MSATSVSAAQTSKRPWHLWTVAILTLLWNGSGTVITLLCQAGRMPGLGPEEVAYYAAQPLWSVIVTDIALLAPMAGAVALLFLNRSAVWLFALGVVAVLVVNGYDIATGTSLVLGDTQALIATCVIVVLAVLQWVYALAMKQKGLLPS